MLFRKDDANIQDSDLVKLVAGGDEKAFRILLDRHQDSIYRFVVRFLGNTSEAEDISQETFIRFFHAADRYRPEAALRTYLLRIAKNLCIDHFRKKRPEPMKELPEKYTTRTPLAIMEQAQSIKRLMEAVNDLPENQRMAILLRHDHDLCYKEISETMNLSIGAVESLLVRARRTLRKTFDKTN